MGTSRFAGKGVGRNTLGAVRKKERKRKKNRRREEEEMHGFG